MGGYVSITAVHKLILPAVQANTGGIREMCAILLLCVMAGDRMDM